MVNKEKSWGICILPELLQKPIVSYLFQSYIFLVISNCINRALVETFQYFDSIMYLFS
jgi:hypothetical protein